MGDRGEGDRGEGDRDGDGDRGGSSSTPAWRRVFDIVEGPITRSSTAWVQSDLFMDGLSVGWRVGRRADRELRRGLELWLGAWRVASRGDLDRLSSELADVQRELRAVHRDLRTLADAAAPKRAPERPARESARRAPARTGRGTRAR